MNLIVIVSDTLRRDYLSCYGNEWVQTPGLQALADEALVFDRCYVGSFPTMPMRADLVSGQYVFHTVGWAPLQPGVVPIQSIAARHGYVTQLITDHVQMLAPGMNYHQGFHGHRWIRGQASDRFITAPLEYDPPCALEKLRAPENWLDQYMRNISVRRTEADWFSPQTMQAGMDWLEANRAHDEFLLWIDTFDVHEPWTPPQWYVDLYDPGYEGEEIIYPRYDRCDYLTEAEIKHCRALYAGTITMMDRWIGKLLDRVRDLGLWDNTAIAFISDHGWYHGEHGYMGKHTVLDRKLGWPFYEEVAHIPFLLRVPGQFESGRSDVLVQPVDVMPTLLEVMGIEPPDGLDGSSALPALAGGAPPREIAVTSPLMSADATVRYYSTITDGRWTLIYAGENAEAELYDLDADPRQAQDVCAENRPIAEDLHNKHVALLQGIDTPGDRLALRRTL